MSVSVQFIITAIVIVISNPDIDDGGWKCDNDCESNGVQFLQCIEECAFSQKEIFPFLNKSLRVQTVYANKFQGLIHFLELDNGMISHDYWSSIAIPLNSTNISYTIFFMDTKIQMYTDRYDTLPLTKIEIQRGQIKIAQVYLQVSI